MFSFLWRDYKFKSEIFFRNAGVGRRSNSLTILSVISLYETVDINRRFGSYGRRSRISCVTWSAVSHFLVTCSAGYDSCSFLVFGPAAALTVQLKHAFQSTATTSDFRVCKDYVRAGPITSALNHSQTIGYFSWRVPQCDPKNRNMGDNSHPAHNKHGRRRLGMILSSSWSSMERSAS